ncbi:ribosomal protein S18-alanine N-acetyltransferase [Glaciibacter flavus]|uniref:ribosomal protein S18-alanine N-acetyltransferase n=1 Tax=Orlajensenia flava TaxID=2565934 RepID=UPI003AFF979D
MSWQLRRAHSADLESIMAIESATFTTDAWSMETMRAELASSHTYYLVAFDPDAPDTIVGYAGLAAPRGGDGDIQTIAVQPAHRGRGLGRGLMNALVDEARRRGAGEILLEVRADNPVAHGLYESLGFADIAVRRGYYQPDGVDAIVMRAPVTPARTAPTTEGSAR